MSSATAPESWRRRVFAVVTITGVAANRASPFFAIKNAPTSMSRSSSATMTRLGRRASRMRSPSSPVPASTHEYPSASRSSQSASRVGASASRRRTSGMTGTRRKEWITLAVWDPRNPYLHVPAARPRRSLRRDALGTWPPPRMAGLSSPSCLAAGQYVSFRMPKRKPTAASAKRKGSEPGRKSAERGRARKEAERNRSEGQRNRAESSREEGEQHRGMAEMFRREAERMRREGEKLRRVAERAREEAEKARTVA